MALLDRAIVKLLPAVPRPLVQRLSERYIAGPACDDAMGVVRQLNAQGKSATIDVLGEEITKAAQAREFAQEYRDVLAAIERDGLVSTVSVKLTALGLKLGYDLCRANLESVVADAAQRSNFVTIDMEDASTTDATLGLYRELRATGYDDVGIVLQASLRRTVADVDAVADLRPNVRLCKGIYIEAAAIQFRDYDTVRRNFVTALGALFDAGCYVGIATHDPWLIEHARRIVGGRGLGRDGYEFQMLLGVRPELGDGLVRDGHRLRIYVPFGEYWYEYSLRRLQENPRIAGYVAADTINRLASVRRG